MSRFLFKLKYTLVYTTVVCYSMMKPDKAIKWNPLKSERLKRTRGVSFEEILQAKIVRDLEHPTRINQRIILVEYKNYVWAVPYVETDDHYFLKTIYPSRQLTKRYRKEEL